MSEETDDWRALCAVLFDESKRVVGVDKQAASALEIASEEIFKMCRCLDKLETDKEPQQIDTAPRDGTKIWFVATVQWDIESASWRDEDSDMVSEPLPGDGWLLLPVK